MRKLKLSGTKLGDDEKQMEQVIKAIQGIPSKGLQHIEWSCNNQSFLDLTLPLGEAVSEMASVKVMTISCDQVESQYEEFYELKRCF